jgi:DNA-directed RNA polymerase subunit M
MFMEFCPKCGGLLLPQKIGRTKKLVCQRCGSKRKIKRRKAYKIAEKGKEPKEVAVIEEEEKKERKPEVPYEEMKPEYYEEYYE